MGNHGDADLAAGNRERLDLRSIAQQYRVYVYRLPPLRTSVSVFASRMISGANH